MKKFTLIKEQHDHQYTWRAVVKLEGTITAGSEGDAGYQVDDTIAEIPNVLTHEIVEIVKGDQTGKPWAEQDDEMDQIDENLSLREDEEQANIWDEMLHRISGYTFPQDFYKVVEILSSKYTITRK